MNEEYDVAPPVPADEGNQEFTESVSEESQVTDKEFNFRALEAERNQLRDEATQYRSKAEENESLVKMYQQMGYQSKQQPPGHEPQSQSQVQPNNGLNFEDAVDGEALNKLSGYFGTQAEQINSQVRQQAEQLEQMQLAQQDPNWRSTIEKYLPEVLQKQPWLADSIKRSPSAWKEAYYHATNNANYYKTSFEQKQSQQAEQIVKNASAPKSLGSVGSQSNLGGHRDAFSLSNDDFASVKAQIRAGTFK